MFLFSHSVAQTAYKKREWEGVGNGVVSFMAFMLFIAGAACDFLTAFMTTFMLFMARSVERGHGQQRDTYCTSIGKLAAECA